MSNNNINSIRSTLLSLYDDGINAAKAQEEINNLYGQNSISLITIYRWFNKFKSGDRNINNKKVATRKKKITDESLIELINNNPNLNMLELATLIGTSQQTISIRIKKLNKNSDSINYCKKDTLKFTDDDLIDLVNKNPDLSKEKLARLLGVSSCAISKRINQINSNGKKINYVSKDNRKHKLEADQTPNPKLTNEAIINLIDNNPDLSIEKLARLANTSTSTMYRRVRKIEKYSDGTNYSKKDNLKFTEDYLIDLINNNSDLSMEKLAKLAGTSMSTISRRLNQINSDSEKVNYMEKNNTKFTDEYLIELINNNPNHSMKMLARIANVSISTISTRIKQINKNGERVKYVRKRAGKAKSETNEKLSAKLSDVPN